MAYDLLTLQDLTRPPSDEVTHPAFDEGWQVRLEKGENIEWHGVASSIHTSRFHNKKWQRTGHISEKCIVVITNKRIVYVCQKFNKGRRMMGTGLVGGGIAVAHNAIKAGIESRELTGKALAGHVRYEWVNDVKTESYKVKLFNFYYMLIDCVDSNGVIRIEFGLPKQEFADVAELLAGLVAIDRGIDPPKAEPSKEVGKLNMYVLEGGKRVPNSEA